ncbi:MAG TPA: hypothetical protein VF459_17690 [Caulobacteraceae bacterium]
MAVDHAAVDPGDSYDGIADRAALAIGSPGLSLVLVGHSGAGGLLAGIAQRVRPAAVIFVDAILPHPGRSWLDTVPPGLGKRLRGLAREGRLPPWNRWFSDDPVARLIADEKVKAGLLAEMPAIPLAYLEARAPDWPHPACPCAYLQLSETYGREAIAARAGAWMVVREDLHHLALLSDPARVAAILVKTAESLAPA